jgi:hypothetical protein
MPLIGLFGSSALRSWPSRWYLAVGVDAQRGGHVERMLDVGHLEHGRPVPDQVEVAGALVEGDVVDDAGAVPRAVADHVLAAVGAADVRPAAAGGVVHADAGVAADGAVGVEPALDGLHALRWALDAVAARPGDALVATVGVPRPGVPAGAALGLPAAAEVEGVADPGDARDRRQARPVAHADGRAGVVAHRRREGARPVLGALGRAHAGDVRPVGGVHRGDGHRVGGEVDRGVPARQVPAVGGRGGVVAEVLRADVVEVTRDVHVVAVGGQPHLGHDAGREARAELRPRAGRGVVGDDGVGGRAVQEAVVELVRRLAPAEGAGEVDLAVGGLLDAEAVAAHAAVAGGVDPRLLRVVPLGDAAQRGLVAALGEGAAQVDVVAVEQEVAHHDGVEGDEVGRALQDAVVLAVRALAREVRGVRQPADVVAPGGEAGRPVRAGGGDVGRAPVAAHVVPGARQVDRRRGGRGVDPDAPHPRVRAAGAVGDDLVGAVVEVEAVEGVAAHRQLERRADEGAADVEVVALGIVGEGLDGAAGADRAVVLHPAERAPLVGARFVRVPHGQRVDVVETVAARVVDLGELARDHQPAVGQPQEVVDHAVGAAAALAAVIVGDDLVATLGRPGPQVPGLVGEALAEVGGVDAGLPAAGDPQLAVVPLQLAHGGLADAVAHAGGGAHARRLGRLGELHRPVRVAGRRPGADEQHRHEGQGGAAHPAGSPLSVARTPSRSRLRHRRPPSRGVRRAAPRTGASRTAHHRSGSG